MRYINLRLLTYLKDAAGTVGLRASDQLKDHAAAMPLRYRHAEDIDRSSRRVPAATPWMTNQAAATAANGHPASVWLTPALSLPVAATDPTHPRSDKTVADWRLDWPDFSISVIDFVHSWAAWPLSDCSLTISAVGSDRRMRLWWTQHLWTFMNAVTK